MSEEKRMIADTGYEVKLSLRLGDREILLAENMNEPEGKHYMKAEYRDNGFIGEYDRIVYGGDYLAVMDECIGAAVQKIAALRQEFEKADYRAKPIAADECFPHDYGQNLNGKVAVIKAEALRPEYRRGDVQLVVVTGGNGARANPNGNAVYCYHLNDGKHARFERYDVLGEIKVLPDWAKERLAAIKAERETKEAPTPETNAGYAITERVTAGNTLFVLGEAPNENAYVTWQRYERGYEHGHYFDNREAAVADLHKRAAVAERASGRETRGDAR